MCDSAVGVETQFPFQPAADGARSIAGRFGVPQAQPIAGGALAAENLFLRKQLALYLERKVNPTLLLENAIACILSIRTPSAPSNWHISVSGSSMIAVKATRHCLLAQYYWLLLAESHLTRRLFGAMLRRIAALPLPGG
jgi:hypothetical protein